MVRALWFAAAFGVMSAILPDGGSDAAPTGRPEAGRFVDGTFTSDAGTRRWKLWVPTGYDASRRHPLVVMLHGCTQDADDLARGTRVTEHADRWGVLVLLPEQPESANPKQCWNWYDAAHQKRDAGEPSLIAGMTRQAMGSWAVDSARVYVAGISAGAAMAANVSVTYPDLYAAVGLHSGIAYGAAENVMQGVSAMSNGATDTAALARKGREAMGERAREIPAIIIQGHADPIVRPVNATQTRDAWLAMNALARGETPRKPALEAGRLFQADAGGLQFTRECHGRRITERLCEVETLMVTGLGHAWSGGSKAGTFTDERGPDATVEMLRFLLAASMPARTAPNARAP
jgi:poly(hydroxyalkanoate) depolymerase family esterase